MFKVLFLFCKKKKQKQSRKCFPQKQNWTFFNFVFVFAKKQYCIFNLVFACCKNKNKIELFAKTKTKQNKQKFEKRNKNTFVFSTRSVFPKNFHPKKRKMILDNPRKKDNILFKLKRVIAQIFIYRKNGHIYWKLKTPQNHFSHLFFNFKKLWLLFLEF